MLRWGAMAYAVLAAAVCAGSIWWRGELPVVLAAPWLVLSPWIAHAYSCLLGGALGWLYPSLWLGERRNKRRRLVIKDLPIYLDFITMAVEAGLNITGGIEQATQKGPTGPLQQEFTRLLRDVRSGLPRAEALAPVQARHAT